jgi:hypothetical protein
VVSHSKNHLVTICSFFYSTAVVWQLPTHGDGDGMAIAVLLKPLISFEMAFGQQQCAYLRAAVSDLAGSTDEQSNSVTGVVGFLRPERSFRLDMQQTSFVQHIERKEGPWGRWRLGLRAEHLNKPT